MESPQSPLRLVFIDLQVGDLSGERGRNRTYNLVIKSHLLCQLSYAPGVSCGFGAGPTAPKRDYIAMQPDFWQMPQLFFHQVVCGGRAAAVICAMSSRRGGAPGSVPRASRNMVWQNGQAVPITPAPVDANCSARSMLT